MPSRSNNFNALRLVAAFFVITGHMYILNGGAAPTIFCSAGIQGVGVYIFFTLGGYFIMKSWLSDRHPLRYAAKRFFRIWPPLAAVVLLSVVIIGPIFTTLPLRTYFRWCLFYFKNLLLNVVYSLPGVFESNPYPSAVNGSLWTLPIEVAMYVFIPIAESIIAHLRSGWARRSVFCGMAVLICVLDCCLLAKPDARLVIYGTDWVSAVHILPFYFIGMLVGYLEADGLPIRDYLNLPLAVTAALLVPALSQQFVSHAALFVVLPYLIFSLGYAPCPILEKAGNKAEITYGIYLFGFPIQQCLMSVLSSRGIVIHSLILTLVSFCLSALAAYALHFLVENPSRKLQKAFLSTEI